jgi:D-3-phosphoglycerate dehydrogenase / 2-oxoglutarate reductase
VSGPAWNVVISQRNFDADSLAFLTQHGCVPIPISLADGLTDGDLDEDELFDRLRDADAWIVGHAHVTRTLLARLPRMRVICRRGVGYERVDTAAVALLGKVATIAVGGNDGAVADHTVGLMLGVAHRFREAQERLKSGDSSVIVGADLFRKTVGVVGLGRIGRGVVSRLRGFECRVLASSPTLDEEYIARSGVHHLQTDALIEQCDYLTLHAPLTAQTRHLICEASIERMKPSAVVINTARGGLVDDTALLAALRTRRLAGAGLDVFESESDPALAPVTEALVRMPNVLATPHSGGSTAESLQRTNLIASRNAVAVLEGGDPPADCVIADGRHRADRR